MVHLLLRGFYEETGIMSEASFASPVAVAQSLDGILMALREHA